MSRVGASEPHDQSPGASWWPGLALVLVAVLGGLAGAALWSLTDSLSRTDIGGPGWSLRGNGALVVPLAGGPAVLAAGWTMLGLWHRAHPDWMKAGLLAGCLALAAGLVGGFLPVFAYRHSLTYGPSVLVAAGLIFTGLALASGLGLARLFGSPGRLSIVLALALSLPLASGPTSPLMLASPLLLPLALTAPLLAARKRGAERPQQHPGRTALGLVLLLIALAAGFYGCAAATPPPPAT